MSRSSMSGRKPQVLRRLQQVSTIPNSNNSNSSHLTNRCGRPWTHLGANLSRWATVVPRKSKIRQRRQLTRKEAWKSSWQRQLLSKKVAPRQVSNFPIVWLASLRSFQRKRNSNSQELAPNAKVQSSGLTGVETKSEGHLTKNWSPHSTPGSIMILLKMIKLLRLRMLVTIWWQQMCSRIGHRARSRHLRVIDSPSSTAKIRPHLGPSKDNSPKRVSLWNRLTSL